MSAVVIVHPGKVGDRDQAQARLAGFVEAAGHDMPQWIETSADDPGPGQARRAVAAGAELIVVWGGDGTMIGVAAALEGTGVPLGILPGGTGNLLARNLGVPLDLAQAAAVAFTGRDRVIDLLGVDLGRGERRVSAVMSGTGWDAEMMAAPEARKRRLGWGAYAIEGALGLRSKPMQLRISVDGGPEQRLAGRTVLVANVGMLVAGLVLVPEARPDDGLLDVLVIDPSSPADWIRTAAGIITRTGSDTDPSRIRFRGSQVEIATGHVRRRQIDGDLVTPGSRLSVRVRPGALVVRVP
ncbi:MAG TPA: diacylglycerol kinase family protein [Ilumatobacteraceae bacterium]|nr:diacylglycerol kinase family protein [Ilumatobacteraceae bacterium]